MSTRKGSKENMDFNEGFKGNHSRDIIDISIGNQGETTNQQASHLMKFPLSKLKKNLIEFNNS